MRQINVYPPVYPVPGMSFPRAIFDAEVRSVVQLRCQFGDYFLECQSGDPRANSASASAPQAARSRTAARLDVRKATHIGTSGEAVALTASPLRSRGESAGGAYQLPLSLSL